MESNPGEQQTPLVIEGLKGQKGQAKSASRDKWNLRRWLVSFASGAGWYPVGEFIAADGASAIERAIEVFGRGAAYRVEEIPWDAAPLPRSSGSRVRSQGSGVRRQESGTASHQRSSNRLTSDP
jgi:hypothetical protein